MKKLFPQSKEGGQAMVLGLLFFVVISGITLFGLAMPIVKERGIASDLFQSRRSYFLAESGVEDAVYRWQNRLTISNSQSFNALGQSATTNSSDQSGMKVLDTTAMWDGRVRKVEIKLSQGVGVAFNYGIQAGDGGFILNGGATVNGNVYSNGSIVATNGVTITGSAVAANSAALTPDQTNDSPTPPPNSITFRDANTTRDFAQSFQLSSSSPINKVSFYIKKVGSPADATVRIVTDSNGAPSTNNIFTNNGTLSAALVGTSGFGWVDVVFPENPNLVPGTTYWLVVSSGSQSASNYYVIGANNTYANGQAKIGKYSGTWNDTSPSGLSGYFQIYLGGLTSTIGGNTYVGGVNIGSAGVGDAWANKVQGANVAGNLFCQTGSFNNKACDTSQPDPTPQPYPVSDANIQDWKAQATAGGITSGNVTVGSAGASIGPQEITGNLVVNGGGTLNVTGTIWVHGTLSLSGGGKIKLDSSFGTSGGVIVADGIVTLAGGGNLSGSGQTGSYLMILTTSSCPFVAGCNGADALTLSGGAGAVILTAQNGNMVLNGGSGVHEATAYRITATGGANITYDKGLVSQNFSSGPSGGWQISSWKETQ